MNYDKTDDPPVDGTATAQESATARESASPRDEHTRTPDPTIATARQSAEATAQQVARAMLDHPTRVVRHAELAEWFGVPLDRYGRFTGFESMALSRVLEDHGQYMRSSAEGVRLCTETEKVEHTGRRALQRALTSLGKVSRVHSNTNVREIDPHTRALMQRQQLVASKMLEGHTDAVRVISAQKRRVPTPLREAAPPATVVRRLSAPFPSDGDEE